MLKTGDIVYCYAATVGYPKYHLCICPPDKKDAGLFLFINSEGGYEADFVLQNSDVPCIQKNDTGLTVISCSMLLRLSEKQLNVYDAKKVGELDTKFISLLKEFIENSKALTRSERQKCSELLVKLLSSDCS